MITVLLVIHLLIALALVITVLLQRSEGGALGIGGGGGGGMGGFMTGRSAANVLTRTTAILAGAFMLTSLVLSLMAAGGSEPTSILDSEGPAAMAPPAGEAEPAPAPAEQPQQPAEPAAPLAR